MFSDEIEGKENPIKGLGKEMLPDRGLPFDDLEEEAKRESSFKAGEITQPRDLSPDELAELLGGTFEPVEDVIDVLSREDEEVEGGMSAAEPIFTGADIDAIDLPLDELGISSSKSITGRPINDEGKSLFPGVGIAKQRDEIRKEPSDFIEDEEMMAHFITKERLSQLWSRIDSAQLNIQAEVPNLILAQELIGQLERARQEFLAGRRNYEEAERTISSVELRIATVRRAREDNWAAVALFLYEIIWGLIFTVFFLQTSQITEITDTVLAANSAIWGGIGGITGAIYALWKHVAKEVDFSKQYYLWYISNPIMGIILGAFIYLVMKGSLLSMSADSRIQDISAPFIIFLLAFIVGYQQNVAWALVRRIVKIFELSGENGPASKD
jgi:hypothetical protein